ncbi:proline-specific peptidase [Abortiporus biennis]|nr:proline-specific peptidase [Abortiporus biennis]
MTSIVEGDVEFFVPSTGQLCKTHYWIHGDLKSRQPPLIVAHGGPGATHYYVANLADLWKTHKIPVILYDQIGNGHSTHLPEKKGDNGFWTVELFVRELENLIDKLGIQEEYDLLGHSWGGMLGASFAAKQPRGLRRLVLASSVARMQDWIDSTSRLKLDLPQDVQDALEKHEGAGTTDSEEYKLAVEKFYEKFLCRINPLPEGMIIDNGWMEKDPTVYHTMNGPSEFHITGHLRSFDITSDLHRITVPTLLTNGRYDGAQDDVMLPFFKEISSRVKWIQFAQSSHTPHLEECERYFSVVGAFLVS